jgi:hypothetical protein
LLLLFDIPTKLDVRFNLSGSGGDIISFSINKQYLLLVFSIKCMRKTQHVAALLNELQDVSETFNDHIMMQDYCQIQKNKTL